MKKRNFLMGMLAFLMMFAASCSNDLDSGMMTTDGTTMVSFSVETPKIASRAYDNPLKLQYAVYAVAEGEEETEVLQELEGLRVNDAVIEGGSTSIKLNLVAGKTYKVIFWAAGENAPYAVDFENKQVVISSESAFFNEASADAFFACHEFTVADDQTDAESVTLVRPVAQLNIGTADLDVAADLGYAPERTTVKVSKIYTTLNLLDGTVDGEKEITFTAKSNTAESSIDFPVAGYDNLAMSYMLVGLDKKVVDIEFTYYLGEMQETRTIGSVPVQRNYKTNIYGSILTKEVDVNINLEDFWGASDIYASWPIIADGVRADAETFDQANTFCIENVEGLEWLSATVGSTEIDGTEFDSSFAGKTVVLAADIDLTKENWDPIGDNRTDIAFKGTFDGQNHIIKGAHITGDHCFNGDVYGSKEGWGLFSVLDGATVKNLKVDGATFGSYSVITGTIAGYANNTTFENIEISNTKIAGYNWYTGGVVGWAAGECTFKGINLANTVAVGTLWDSHGQNAGGIAGGVSASAKITIEDCNIACVLDVINDVTSNYKWWIYRVSGMIIGNTNDTQTIDGDVFAAATNVTCKNVTVTYGEWMNYHYCEGFWNRGWGRYESSDYVGGVDEDEPHNHADGEEHLVAIPFDQLFGGGPNGGGRSPVKGLAEFPGVTVNYPAEYTCSICGEVHNAVNNE